MPARPAEPDTLVVATPMPRERIVLDSPPLPRSLQVEVTGACNLKCRMCLVRYRPALSRSACFSIESFRALLDQLPSLERVTLQGLGEPLMAPDIVAMVEECAGRGIDCGFNTNATLLTERTAERLVDAGLGWLHVSIDGASRETYEFVREHANWDIVARNLDSLRHVMQERRALKPALSVTMVLMRFNFVDLPGVVRRAAEWRIPTVRAQNLSHDFSDAPPDAYGAIAGFVEEQSLATVAASDVAAVFAEARDVAAATGVVLRLPRLVPGRQQRRLDGVAVPCEWPWSGAYVGWQGDVQPCCMVMGSERLKLGSIASSSFADVWEGEDYRTFRRRLLSEDPPAVCRGCSEYRGTF